MAHLDFFPVEVNTADYETLLRVPGVGVVTPPPPRGPPPTLKRGGWGTPPPPPKTPPSVPPPAPTPPIQHTPQKRGGDASLQIKSQAPNRT